LSDQISPWSLPYDLKGYIFLLLINLKLIDNFLVLGHNYLSLIKILPFESNLLDLELVNPIFENLEAYFEFISIYGLS